jgi:hypothetical protein
VKALLAWVGLLGAAALITVALIHHFTGGPSDPTGYQVASQIGAGDCTRSDYAIEDRLTGKSSAIYDCWKSGRGYYCVTLDGGLAHNVTVEARLLFADVLAGARPDCLTGG